MKTIWKKLNSASLLLLSISVSGCLTARDSAHAAPLPRADPSIAALGSAAYLLQECQLLANTGGGLDADGFTLFNWNIKKGEIVNWEADLVDLAGDADLVLIQEATQKMDAPRFVGEDAHWSFSPGYSRGELVSGVATISSVQPLEQCRLLTVEPWLRTPKATMATLFAIQDSVETLLVINTHMVNFTIGHAAFRRQLAEVEGLFDSHTGPIVFSGDFNTWRAARYEILLKMTSRFGLTPISFDQDYRAKFFGSPVDHVFIGGLEVEDATTHLVSSSDHNPMTLRLTL